MNSPRNRSTGGNRTASRVNRSAGRLASAGGLLAFIATLTGCNLDSYIDPTQVGRWEDVPTTMPILTRIASIEGTEEAFIEVSNIEAQDLIPDLADYRVGPGDALEITVWDLVAVGQPDIFQRLVDSRGFVDIPQLGQVFVSGRTATEVQDAIGQAAASIVANPLVTVQVISKRQETFNVFGSIRSPGPYLIPVADYRILEALTAAGGVSSAIPEVFVIRQVKLTPEAAGEHTPGAAPDAPSSTEGERLLDLIDELGGSGNNAGGAPSDGGMAIRSLRPASPYRQPAGQPGGQPAVDLIDDSAEPGAPVQPPEGGPRTTWMFLDGKWVQVARPEGGDASTEGLTPGELVTQRVIRVPTKQLLSGDARVNVVVRPGDIIRVPEPDQGQIYMGGNIARPGVYSLPFTGRLTLLRAMDAAGGLNAVGIPERIDLTRVVGPDRQATIRVNLRAIAEQTQPDIYLKPDDRINVGTTFWATPLAVVRNGFRFSYGFGFLLDRNFGNDVFGAPPSNVGN
ncbi:MAG: polysaccharide biosynthesis/export family protein [Phycisphaerales bacterium]|nr:polysaccharide biosynthesis/export family protein [Phycisphaerales bacterium]